MVNKDFDLDGYDSEGFDHRGLDRQGFRRDGYSLNGYDKDGFGRDSYNLNGYNKEGFARDGFDSSGYDKDGYDLQGFDRDGFDKNCNDSHGKFSLTKWEETINLILQPSGNDSIKCQEQFSPAQWADILSLIIRPFAYNDTFSEVQEVCDDYANYDPDKGSPKGQLFSVNDAKSEAIEFYSELLGFNIENFSVEQLTRQTISWSDYDRYLNDKNCVRNPNSYNDVAPLLNMDDTNFQHCVIRFNGNENKQNMIIAGLSSSSSILADYSGYSQVAEDQFEWSDVVGFISCITFLGETTFLKLQQLKKQFKSGIFELTVSSNDFIPSWGLEYPEKFYAIKKWTQTKLQQLAIESPPLLVEFYRNNTNPIPAYLASGISLPDTWMANLKKWQIHFYNRLLPGKNKIITMPFLFLSLLTDFLEMLTQKDLWEKYEPMEYRQLIFDDILNDKDRILPLGFLDPERCIESLIRTLSILWEYKSLTSLGDYRFFRFDASELLEGKRADQDSYETIFTYCRGSIEGTVMCGNIPLIVGVHEKCPECEALICEKCGHCSAHCSLCRDRMENAKGALFEIANRSVLVDGKIAPFHGNYEEPV